MSKGIFLRVETYGLHRARKARTRRATVSDLVAEIERRRGHREHVDDLAPEGHRRVTGPRPPVILAGSRPSQVKRRISREVPEARDARGRAPRRDQRVLVGCVVSAPVTPATYETDPTAKALVDQYFEQARAFLERYLAEEGGEVASAVAHVDESYMHMHVLAVPSGVPGYRADALHPAKAAERAARAQGAAPSVARAEGRNVLEAFLDRFHAEVGHQFGLMRKTADDPRPRVPRQQIIEDRRQLNDQLTTSEGAEPAVSTSGTDDAVGQGAWRLDDFVPGANALLASLSPKWWTHDPALEPSHEQEGAAGSTLGAVPSRRNRDVTRFRSKNANGTRMAFPQAQPL